MRRTLLYGTLLVFGLASFPLGAAPGRQIALDEGGYLRCSEPGGSVVRLTEHVTARVAQGTQLQVTKTPTGCAVSQVQGRVFLRVASAPLVLDAGSVHVEATRGELLVDVGPSGQTSLQIFNGDATVRQVAGKDFRVRGIRRDKVSNRKDQTKGLGRVKPKPKAVAEVPEPLPTPPVAPPPATPPAAPKWLGPLAPESLPEIAGGGLSGLEVFGVIGGVGGIIGTIVATTTGPEESTPPLIVPASP